MVQTFPNSHSILEIVSAKLRLASTDVIILVMGQIMQVHPLADTTQKCT